VPKEENEHNQSITRPAASRIYPKGEAGRDAKTEEQAASR